MIAGGRTGRRGRGRLLPPSRAGRRRVKEALDLATDRYRPVSRPRLDSLEVSRGSLPALLVHTDGGGRFAARVVTETLAYAGRTPRPIAADVAAVDRAMRLGYGWAAGPFELLDQLGPQWVIDRLRDAGRPVPPLLAEVADRSFYRRTDHGLAARDRRGGYRELGPRPGTLRLDDVRHRRQPVAANASASLWDLGDGVACVEFHSKLNTLDRDSLAMLRTALEVVPRQFLGARCGQRRRALLGRA